MGTLTSVNFHNNLATLRATYDRGTTSEWVTIKDDDDAVSIHLFAPPAQVAATLRRLAADVEAQAHTETRVLNDIDAPLSCAEVVAAVNNRNVGVTLDGAS